MSQSQTKQVKDQYILRNPLPQHFKGIQDLCLKVYPFSKPWSAEQLESHRAYFPDGQLIVIDKKTKKVVGLAFSLIIDWNDYSPQDNWQDFTAGGFFHNHDPKKGKTLYGAEVMVDPEYRGQGIGRLLYKGREQIAEKYKLRRIRAGARLRGYSKFQQQYTPDEYTKQVVLKKIYDPTLSFQLGRGFHVIDVAPNYLFNDPESLGYAAVIEWLNPKTNNVKSFERQAAAVRSFLHEEKYSPQYLHRDLRRLVRKTTTLLGQVIRELEGEEFYRKVENYRGKLKATRIQSDKNFQTLKSLKKVLEKEKPEDQYKIAHAFTLQLELVNVSESAYRTWRHKHRPSPPSAKHKTDLTYVLTAHPTESRSKICVDSMKQVQEILLDGAYSNFVFNEKSLKSKLRLLWFSSFAKKKKPSVLDEAEYIYSIIFSDEVFDFLIEEKPTYNLKLRTWVGGDKDGHPGIDKDVMKDCLQGSRDYLYEMIEYRLEEIVDELDSIDRKESAVDQFWDLLQEFKKLKKITHSDGTKIKKWVYKFNLIYKKSNLLVKNHEYVRDIIRILELFPGLVLPLELREDAGVIKSSLSQNNMAIREMLSELNKISGAMSITSYARGLVISHCEEAEDISNAGKLIELSCKNRDLPIIPLFESREALLASQKILNKWLTDLKNQETVYRIWNNKMEIMLGYSDSSKQIGVFPSRTLIKKSMSAIEKVLKKFQVTPIFFHGSGGSVARGGGSIKEQISWWPKTAIENPKMTIQGEMINRIFSTREILNAHSMHLANESSKRRFVKRKVNVTQEMGQFAQNVEAEYLRLVKNTELLEQLLDVTPYNYLDLLKIGSRPSKRKSGEFSLDSLRAIPWVLCWTQTRILLPTWWGVGTAWSKLNKQQKANLKKSFEKNEFMISYVKNLGFTLAKVDLNVWKLYLKENIELYKKTEDEFKKSCQFVAEMTGKQDLIWHKPWLSESIRLRSPHIHILNLLQMIAIEQKNEKVLKESIVGIASGMLTTG